MKTLTLMRHAKAALSEGGIEDHQRPLTAQGHAAAMAVGKSSTAPDLVLCSTALRTRQTLEDIAQCWPVRPAILFEPACYLATPGTLLRRIQAVDDAVQNLWVIGHNPGLHELALRLCPGRIGDRFPTACRAVIQSEAESWALFGQEVSVLAAFLTGP
jgi:phosphohistidine phosphatase